MKKLFLVQSIHLSNTSKWLIGLLFLVIIFIYYGDTLKNGYSLDDEFIYTSNSIATNGLSDITSIFSETSFDYGTYKFGYRPISVLSFAIENEFFGINPKVSHLVNLLLYFGGVYLLFSFLLKFLPNELVLPSFLTTLLFLCLPIHTELVNNIKCRDELLMLYFGLLALNMWLKSAQHKIYYVAVIFALLASILSKKTGFIFLGIIPLIVFFKTEGSWKKALKVLSLMIIPVFLFKLTTKFLKNSKSVREYNFVENPLFGGELEYNHLTIVLESNWFYLKSLLFPSEFIAYYGYKTLPIQGFSLGAIIGGLLSTILILLSFKVFKQRKPYLFGLIVMLVGLFPFLNIITPMVGIVAERFTTVASIGSCIFVLFGVKDLLIRFQLTQLNKYAISLIFIYCMAYLPFIKARNREWKSKFTVMEADLQKMPANVILLSNLASNYSDKFRVLKTKKEQVFYGERIISLTQKANTVYPLAENYFILGSTQYLAFKNVKAAEKNLLNALGLDSTHLGALNNLALMYKEIQENEKSIEYYKKLVNLYPSQELNYSTLAQLLTLINQFIEANKWLDKGIAINGISYEFALSKGNVYYINRDVENAIYWYEKTLEFNPNNSEIKNRLTFLKTQLK